MRKLFILLSILFLSATPKLFSQDTTGVEIYLITCDPGIETYSHYGHSALRVVTPSNNMDLVYNWGVFDFSTPNFAWKFAKGRLNYMLAVYPYSEFLQDYTYEQRSVYVQKINLEPAEIEILFSLLAENLKPENRKYRYDFFYDDCSTRIRDLLEKSLGKALVYAPIQTVDQPTFREKVGEYQKGYPWLDLGIDLIMGISADKKAYPRDQMFLPIDLQRELSDARVNRDEKMIPLLTNPEAAIKFPLPELKMKFYSSPLIILGVILILIIIFSAQFKGKTINNSLDLILFSGYSILALLMIFFNFFTDHEQMKMNLNIIWLNPFILLCLASLVLKKNWQIWFRIVFALAVLFFLPLFFMPRVFNNALIPIALILILRSSIRAGFSWNPFTNDGSRED
jgi:hypothetical protein